MPSFVVRKFSVIKPWSDFFRVKFGLQTLQDELSFKIFRSICLKNKVLQRIIKWIFSDVWIKFFLNKLWSFNSKIHYKIWQNKGSIRQTQMSRYLMCKSKSWNNIYGIKIIWCIMPIFRIPKVSSLKYRILISWIFGLGENTF